jgi:ribose transport system substrate-binding protein
MPSVPHVMEGPALSARHRRRPIRSMLLPAFLALALAGVAACSSGGSTSGGSGSAEKVTVVVSVREVAGAYHAAWVAGSKAFAASVGADFKVLVSGDDSQNQLTQIQSLLATTKGKVVLNMDPNTNSILQATVNAVQRNPNAYLVSQWNKPSGYLPWDGHDRWVSFISYDGVDAGYLTAKELFKAMGGKGNIVAIQGILDNVPNQLRYAGLQKALKENPGIKMLATQPADWDSAKANTVTKTFLAKYGSQINGIWGADDGTALGSASALKAAGKPDVPVVSAAGGTPEAFTSIATGKGVIATTDPDPYWQGGAGSAIGYYAAIGKLDPKKMTHEQRAFNAKQFLVTPSTVKEYQASHSPAGYMAEFALDKVFDRIVSPVTS